MHAVTAMVSMPRPHGLGEGRGVTSPVSLKLSCYSQVGWTVAANHGGPPPAQDTPTYAHHNHTRVTWRSLLSVRVVCMQVGMPTGSHLPTAPSQRRHSARCAPHEGLHRGHTRGCTKGL